MNSHEVVNSGVTRPFDELPAPSWDSWLSLHQSGCQESILQLFHMTDDQALRSLDEIAHAFVLPYRFATSSLEWICEPKIDELAKVSQTESTFRRLVEQWQNETAILSSVHEMVLNPAYQRIIGLGPAVVPALLRQLQTDSGHWFWALTAVTGEDPAESADTYDAAVEAWLVWGRERGYLQ